MMQSNFIKIALRNLWRNKVYSFISIFGLSAGIASCLLIFLYVSDELSFDNFHDKKDRIYRLHTVSHFNGDMVTALSNFGTGPTLKQDYPEIESFVRFRGLGQVNMSITEKVFNEEDIWMTDSTVFDVFSYKLIEGDAKTALTAPNSIVLTASLKQRFFGDELALGKQIKVNNTMSTVTGVIKDVPENTDIKINALISLSSMPPPMQEAFLQDWFRIGFYTYLLFRNVPNVAEFEQKLVQFEEKYVQPWSAANQIVASHEYFITPISEVHFQQGLDYDLPKGNFNYILIFSLLAIFILIIASINYINLSLAQGAKRAKEVGVRKTLGADRSELTWQFIGESLIVTLIACIIGLGLVEVLLGAFNSVTQKDFTLWHVLSPAMMMAMLTIVLVVGVLAGSYPSFVLSSFDPVGVLKGNLKLSSGGNGLKRALILVQFVFSLFMIIGTMLISDQLTFLRNMDLGFERENVLVINLPADSNVTKKIAPWAERLRTESSIAAVSNTNAPSGNTGELMFRIEQDGLLKEQTIRFLFVDEHFIDVLGLNLLKGRNFDRNIATDQQQAFIINQHAAKTFGWNEQSLDKRIQWGLQPNNQASNDGKVVGVVNDFNFLSLHNQIEPLVLCYNPNGQRIVTVRFKAGDYTPTMAKIEADWKNIAPNHEFSYRFLDQVLDQLYRQENTMGKLFTYFSVLSLIIAAMGLFALLSFSIQNRAKEIGVRKVLGASLMQISWVLVKEFFILLLLAFVLIAPLNIYLMNGWLASFAYSTTIQPISFVLSLLVAFLITSLTVSFHIYKISKADPILSLRYE